MTGDQLTACISQAIRDFDEIYKIEYHSTDKTLNVMGLMHDKPTRCKYIYTVSDGIIRKD